MSIPASLSIAASDGELAINTAEIVVQALDGNGEALAGVFNFDLWLSDATTGAGLTGTTASGSVSNKTSAGLVVDTYTAKKALKVQTLADGSFTLSILDSAKTPFVVCAQVPATGRVVTLPLTAGDFG